MKKLSIFMPAIRTENWDAMYQSIEKSCTTLPWELVLCGPFELTEFLKGKTKTKHVKDFGSPSRCAQLASFECEGDLIFHCVDDALMLEGSIDSCLKQYKLVCGKKDIINCKYREGLNYQGESMRQDYWYAWGHDALRLPGIPRHYKMSCHHILDAEYFREMGGYDCSFLYQNFNLHDFIFRCQWNGSSVIESQVDVTSCDHGQADHKVIEDAHNEHDYPLFKKIYGSDSNALQGRKIDLNNFSNSPLVWNKRFKNGIPKSYNELVRE